jgi:hypothetical protein
MKIAGNTQTVLVEKLLEQICLKRGGELHPDHIKQFALYPELRYELSNGRTLCADCHRKTESWGKNIPKVSYTSGAYKQYLK